MSTFYAVFNTLFSLVIVLVSVYLGYYILWNGVLLRFHAVRQFIELIKKEIAMHTEKQRLKKELEEKKAAAKESATSSEGASNSNTIPKSAPFSPSTHRASYVFSRSGEQHNRMKRDSISLLKWQEEQIRRRTSSDADPKTSPSPANSVAGTISVYDLAELFEPPSLSLPKFIVELEKTSELEIFAQSTPLKITQEGSNLRFFVKSQGNKLHPLDQYLADKLSNNNNSSGLVTLIRLSKLDLSISDLKLIYSLLSLSLSYSINLEKSKSNPRYADIQELLPILDAEIVAQALLTTGIKMEAPQFTDLRKLLQSRENLRQLTRSQYQLERNIHTSIINCIADPTQRPNFSSFSARDFEDKISLILRLPFFRDFNSLKFPILKKLDDILAEVQKTSSSG